MTKRRILIVDDEDDIREVAQISLEVVADWKVLTASSGCEGLKIARSAQPDAILLDVMMPDLDGPTTFQKLQADPAIRDIPVILLTAKLQPSDRKHFSELGVAGVLAKPFDPLELAGQVRDTLHWLT
jgi:CheY-like chemotaxis protein